MVGWPDSIGRCTGVSLGWEEISPPPVIARRSARGRWVFSEEARATKAPGRAGRPHRTGTNRRATISCPAGASTKSKNFFTAPVGAALEMSTSGRLMG
jgi:hypothetical protein